jgi:hypothetical protein
MTLQLRRLETIVGVAVGRDHLVAHQGQERAPRSSHAR